MRKTSSVSGAEVRDEDSDGRRRRVMKDGAIQAYERASYKPMSEQAAVSR